MSFIREALRDKPLALYAMDDTAPFQDYSGFNRSGTNSGSAPANAASLALGTKFSQVFNNSTVASFQAPVMTKDLEYLPFSLEAWFQLVPGLNTAEQQVLGNTGSMDGLTVNRNTVSFVVKFTNAPEARVSYTFQYGHSVHAVGVKTKNKIALFVNGELAKEKSLTETQQKSKYLATDGNLYSGSTAGDSSIMLGPVGFYASAILPASIKRHYQAGNTVPNTLSVHTSFSGDYIPLVSLTNNHFMKRTWTNQRDWRIGILDNVNVIAGVLRPQYGRYGAVGDVNLAWSPRAETSGITWLTSRWFGGSGAGTHTYMRGQEDGPGQITSYIRKQWTTAATSNNDTGFEITQGNSSQRYPVVAGDTVNVGSFMRASVVKTRYLRIIWFNASNGQISTVNGSTTDLAANQWNWQSASFVAPANAVSFRVLSDIVGGTGGLWKVGDTLDATGLLVQVNQNTGIYFDGSMTGASWQGNSHSSASTLESTDISVPGSYLSNISLGSSGDSSIYGISADWDGLGVKVSFSLNGVTWERATRNNLISLIPQGFNPQNQEIQVRVEFMGGVPLDESFVKTMTVTGHKNNVLPAIEGRTATLTKVSPRSEKPVLLYHDSWGANIASGGSVVFSADSSPSASPVRTIEMWIKRTESTQPTFSISGTNYRNGLASSAALSLNQWTLVHIVSSSDITGTVTINGPAQVGKTTLYDRVLSATDIANIYSAYTLSSPLQSNDNTPITLTESLVPVTVYAFDWALQGTAV